MKPVAVIVGLFAILAVHVTAEHPVKKIEDKCKSKTGATDDDLKNLGPDLMPQTHIEECFLGCMNHELGVVNPDNTINVEQLKVMYDHLKEKEPDLYQKSIQISETCASKITANSDDCAAAKILSQCFVDEGAKIGLTMPE